MSKVISPSEHYQNGCERFDDEGRKQKYLYNAVGSALSAGYIGRISYDSTVDGLCCAALADGQYYQRIVVAAEDISSADYGWFFIEGSGISATLAANGTGTATHALNVSNGAVSTLGATIAFDDKEFGIIDTSFETTTAITITLLGRECVGTT